MAEDHPLAKGASVTVAGRQTSVDHLPIQTRQHAYQLEAAAHASQHALSQAGIQSKDLDLVEVHDCFTSNQLMCLEALGLSRHGEAGQDYLAGHYDDGPCKVNLSGGLKSKGHPVGATGVSMHYLAYRQLTGNPIGAAHGGEPEHAAVLNVGGSGVVNCATVMRRVC